MEDCGAASSGGGSDRVPTLPPPCPKSPPKYPDLYGKRREKAKVEMLEREIGFLQEELKFVDRIRPSLRCCKEVSDFVVANPDPLVPTNRKNRRPCRFWKWLCGIPAFIFSRVCCCSYSCCSLRVELPRCRSSNCCGSCFCCDSNCCPRPNCCCICDLCARLCSSCLSCLTPMKWQCCSACSYLKSNCCKKNPCCCGFQFCKPSCPDCSCCVFKSWTCSCSCSCSCPQCPHPRNICISCSNCTNACCSNPCCLFI